MRARRSVAAGGSAGARSTARIGGGAERAGGRMGSASQDVERTGSAPRTVAIALGMSVIAPVDRDFERERAAPERKGRLGSASTGMKPGRGKPLTARLVAALGALIAAVSAAGRPAEAQTPRTVRLEYDAPAGCPDARSFEAQIRARSAKVAVGADAPVAVRVRIVARGGRFEGEVSLPDARGHESRREVDGACADVTAALALIAALALDPTASTAPNAVPAPSVASSGGSLAADAGNPAAGATSPPSATPAIELPARVVASPPQPPPARERGTAAISEALSDEVARTHDWAWSIGAHGAVTGGVTPAPLPSVVAFLDVWRRSARAFAPALRLRFERADSGSVVVGSSGAGADFVWTAGSVDLCPVALSPWRFRFTACARGEAGALSATGIGVTPTRTSTRPWVTAGAVVRARLTVIGALFVEAEGGGFAPFVRDRFFVEAADATIQHAPAFAAAGAAGLGVTFW